MQFVDVSSLEDVACPGQLSSNHAMKGRPSLQPHFLDQRDSLDWNFPKMCQGIQTIIPLLHV